MKGVKFLLEDCYCNFRIEMLLLPFNAPIFIMAQLAGMVRSQYGSEPTEGIVPIELV